MIDYGTGVITFGYDNADNRVRMEAPDTTADYIYDDLNRLQVRRQWILGTLYVTGHEYDGNDNLTFIDYPTNLGVTYQHNAKNQVTSVSGQGWAISDIKYHTTGTAIGLPKTMTYSNMVMTELTYTARNLTKTLLASPLVLDLVYGYDVRGNLKEIKDDLDLARNQAFTYDGLNRLKTFNGPWGKGTFTYSPTGNRKTKKLNGVLTSYSYSNHRLASTTGGEESSFRYNQDGDATWMTGGGQEYELRYDRLHHLRNCLSYSGDSLARYSYDGDGQRITKTTPVATTVYHHGKDGILSETDEHGVRKADYVYLHGRLALRVTSEGVSFYHVDSAGTPLAMTDSTGTAVWRAEYKPFGEEFEVTPEPENNKMFVGKEMDKETGLYYFGARYMEPMIGRFVSPDPVGAVDPKTGRVNMKVITNPQGLNLYSYGLNNPYRYLDSNGRIWVTMENKERTLRNIFDWVMRNPEKSMGKKEWFDPIKDATGRLGKAPDPGELIGKKRELIQEWQSDPEHPELDKQFDLRTRRVIEQAFEKSDWSRDDKGDIAITYGWRPAVPDRTYENVPGAKIDTSNVKPEDKRRYWRSSP